MAIRWIEINPATSTAGTIAGRRDTPTTGEGESAGAAVQFIFGGANAWSLNRRIGEELARLESLAEANIPADSSDGVLANVVITTNTDWMSGVSASSFQTIGLAGPPFHFSEPGRGIRAAGRMEFLWGGNGTVSHRYFWGVRV